MSADAKHERINEIDLLRFVAAMMVVVYHYCFRGNAADSMSRLAFPLLADFAKYGYLGVELFFVISGFVILMSAADGNVRRFVISRLIRLYPAFWACCTITFCLTWYLGGGRYQATWQQYMVNMTMLSEFFRVESIDGVYWSLFVEMKFYAIVVVVMTILGIRRFEWFATAWLGLTLTMDLLGIGRFRSPLIIDYCAFFVAGATFYAAWRDGFNGHRIVVLLVCWGMTVYQAINPDHIQRMGARFSTSFDPMVIAMLVSSIYLVMTLVALRRLGVISRMNWKTVGALTYPLYLIHQYAGFMLMNRFSDGINKYALLIAVVTLALLAAWLVNRFVEVPLAGLMKRLLTSAAIGTHLQRDTSQ